MRTSSGWNRDNTMVQGVAIGTPTSNKGKIIIPTVKESKNVWKSNRQTVYKFNSPSKTEPTELFGKQCRSFNVDLQPIIQIDQQQTERKGS